MKQVHKIKTTLLVAFACASGALANDAPPYPRARVAEFVVETLDATSLPSPFRPKQKGGGKTLTNDGYTVETLGENEAMLKAPGKAANISIRILEESEKGIYACMTTEARSFLEPEEQRVMLLRRKNSSALLNARPSWREFDSCPVIGGFPTNTAGE